MVAMGSIDVLIDLGGGFILGLIAGFLPVEDNVSDNIYLLLIIFNSARTAFVSKMSNSNSSSSYYLSENKTVKKAILQFVLTSTYN